MAYTVNFELDLDTSLVDSFNKWSEYSFRLKIVLGDSLIFLSKHLPVGANGMVQYSLNYKSQEEAANSMQYCDFYVDVYWKKKRIATEIRLREPQQYKWYHTGTSPDYNLKSGHQDKSYKADKPKFDKLATVKEVVKLPTTKGANSTKPENTVTQNISVSVKSFVINYSGEIQRVTPKNISDHGVYQYIYIDKTGATHNIGIFKYSVVAKAYKGVTNLELIDARQFKGYQSNGVAAKFASYNTSNRHYINTACFAAILGALCDHAIVDMGFNGFSLEDGNTRAPSVSHYNGENGDFRYLRKDRSAGTLNIAQTPDAFDVARQVLFVNSLYKYGYGRTKNMLSYTFTLNGKAQMLPHCSHLSHHDHHLHIQGFNHKSVINIIK